MPASPSGLSSLLARARSGLWAAALLAAMLSACGTQPVRVTGPALKTKSSEIARGKLFGTPCFGAHTSSRTLDLHCPILRSLIPHSIPLYVTEWFDAKETKTTTLTFTLTCLEDD